MGWRPGQVEALTLSRIPGWFWVVRRGGVRQVDAVGDSETVIVIVAVDPSLRPVPSPPLPPRAHPGRIGAPTPSPGRLGHLQ